MRTTLALALVVALVLPAIAAAQQCQCGSVPRGSAWPIPNFGVDMSKIGSRDVRLDKLPEIEGQVSAIATGLRHIREDLEVYHYVQLSAIAGLAVLQVACMAATRAKK